MCIVGSNNDKACVCLRKYNIEKHDLILKNDDILLYLRLDVKAVFVHSLICCYIIF